MRWVRLAVPDAIKGVVEILLIADAGDVTGMDGELFARLGAHVARMSAAAVREVVGHEAWVVVEHELRPRHRIARRQRRSVVRPVRGR